MSNKDNKLNIPSLIVKLILILLTTVLVCTIYVLITKYSTTSNKAIDNASTDIESDNEIKENIEETAVENIENSNLINDILESEFVTKNISNPRIVEVTTINKNNTDSEKNESYNYINQLYIVSGETDESINNNISNFSSGFIFDKDNNKLESLQIQFETINNLDMSMQYISEVSTMLSEILDADEINELSLSNIEKDILIDGDTFKASQSTNNTNESIIINFQITNNKSEHNISIEEIRELGLDIPTLPRIANNYLDDKFIEKLNNCIISNTVDKEEFYLESLNRYVTSNIEDNTMVYKSKLTGTVVTISNSIMQKASSDKLENDNYSISIQFSESSDDFLKEKAVEFSKELFNREITKENILETENSNTYNLLENNIKINISDNSLMISTDYSTVEGTETVLISETAESSE